MGMWNHKAALELLGLNKALLLPYILYHLRLRGYIFFLGSMKLLSLHPAETPRCFIVLILGLLLDCWLPLGMQVT